MEWRFGARSGFFAVLFSTGAVAIVTWYAVSASAIHPLPIWPIFMFIGLMVLGIGGFIFAMVAPHRLPGHAVAEIEEQAREKRRHEGELVLESKKTQRGKDRL